MTKSEIINDFVNFVCNGNYTLINDFELIIAADHYKSFISGLDETQAVRQNEQQQEHCKNPEGKDSCNYKDKDLFACLALRKCPFCDAS